MYLLSPPPLKVPGNGFLSRLISYLLNTTHAHLHLSAGLEAALRECIL